MINLTNITKNESYMLLRILNVSITASHEYDDFPKGMETLVRKLMETAHDYQPYRYDFRSVSYSPLADLMVKIKNETASTTTSRKK